jgi:hypothetical protein
MLLRPDQGIARKGDLWVNADRSITGRVDVVAPRPAGDRVG